MAEPCRIPLPGGFYALVDAEGLHIKRTRAAPGKALWDRASGSSLAAVMRINRRIERVRSLLEKAGSDG